LGKQRQLEKIRYKLKRTKTLDRKISSMEEQLKKLKAEKQSLYEQYVEFLSNSNVESAVRMLAENEKKIKNSLRFLV
jgi:uncharacterized protein (DUF3084 family)